MTYYYLSRKSLTPSCLYIIALYNPSTSRIGNQRQKYRMCLKKLNNANRTVGRIVKLSCKIKKNKLTNNPNIVMLV